MAKLTLDNRPERLHRKFSFSWKEYGFKTKYLTSSNETYVHVLILGPENKEKMEHYRRLHRGRRITVDKLKEERTLGQGWSLEAALESLLGGRK